MSRARASFTVYQDKTGQWRWRFRKGSRITSDSGESYTRKHDCVRAVHRAMAGMTDAQIVIEDLKKRADS